MAGFSACVAYVQDGSKTPANAGVYVYSALRISLADVKARKVALTPFGRTKVVAPMRVFFIHERLLF